jgi:hypothetical protein
MASKHKAKNETKSETTTTCLFKHKMDNKKNQTTQ